MHILKYFQITLVLFIVEGAFANMAETQKTALSGQIVVLSDVQTFPDIPLDSGFIIAIPVSQRALLQSKFTLDNQVDWPFIELMLSDAELLQMSATITSINNKGYYNLEINNGKYFICVAKKYTDKAISESGFYLEGCIEDVLISNDTKVLDLTIGEGGVTKK